MGLAVEVWEEEASSFADYIVCAEYFLCLIVLGKNKLFD